MVIKKGKLPNCKECSLGFVPLDEENWYCVGLIEKYGMNVFIDGMGGIDTNAIKNVLESEGFEGEDYKSNFHNLVIFITTAITTSRDKTR